MLAFSKLYGVVFLGSPRSHHVAECTEVDSQRIVAMALPAMFILVIGLLPQYAIRPVALVAEAVTGADSGLAVASFVPMLQKLSYIGVMLLLLIALLYVIKRRAQLMRKIESGPTWGCGFTATNTRMQYTGESFSEGLENIGKPLMKDTVDGRAVDKCEIFPSEHNYEIKHKDKVDSILGQWWVKLMHRINMYVMRLRTGRVNNYVTFALVFLAVVLIFTIIGIL